MSFPSRKPPSKDAVGLDRDVDWHLQTPQHERDEAASGSADYEVKEIAR